MRWRESRTLGRNTKMPKIDGIPDGTIHLIRFIRSNRKLDIFGEKFEVLKELVYSYVRAEIVTELHQLRVYLGDDCVHVFEYRMPK